jgi:acyl-coenzyme A thioesterase PaaI-like protein
VTSGLSQDLPDGLCDASDRDSYADYVVAFRQLQDAAVSIDAVGGDTAALAARFRALADELENAPGYLFDFVAARGFDLPRVQGPFSVPMTVHEARPGYTLATVRFHRIHHGRGGAAHGGAEALLFDEVLGRMSNYPGEPPSRTAFLTTNYRSIAPIEKDLRVEGTVDRVEGRKKFSSGRLWDGDTLVADATALFVVLKPGQP